MPVQSPRLSQSPSQPFTSSQVAVSMGTSRVSLNLPKFGSPLELECVLMASLGSKLQFGVEHTQPIVT